MNKITKKQIKQKTNYLRAAENKHAKNSPGKPVVVFRVSITNNGNNLKFNFYKKKNLQ